MPTIYDVAKRAGVSTYTVSCVLNKSAYVSPELTARVLVAVKELDYTPNAVARSLQTRATKTIAMLIPNIGNPFYANVVRGVEDRLRKDGYSLLIGSTYDEIPEQNRYLNLFKARQADAVLLFVAPGGEDDVAKLVNARKPVVCVGRVPKSFEADSVSANNIQGTQLAMEYLIARGHKHIGIVTGQTTLSTSTDRIEGWRRTLKKHKLACGDTLIEISDHTEAAGCEATHRLLDRESSLTAIFASNFPLMTGVVRALNERMLAVPSQIQVASSDDSEWLDIFLPAITTVAQPAYLMGERAADLALQRIKDPDRPFTKVVIAPTLHPRG
ncbi:MAG: LacI family transcriptional regulator [Acidobacteria bacterium]|nr:LacI family transcriptional regulator [Acidobacteriota bacterium]